MQNKDIHLNLSKESVVVDVLIELIDGIDLNVTQKIADHISGGFGTGCLIGTGDPKTIQCSVVARKPSIVIKNNECIIN